MSMAALVTYFSALSRNFPGGTEVNQNLRTVCPDREQNQTLS
jgi:hypothetical protein